MFLRKRTTPTGGVSYSLLRSVRQDGSPRHEVVACLGPFPTVAQALAAEIIDGEDDMLTLVVWENRPNCATVRRIKDRFGKRAQRIRKLIEALVLADGTRADIVPHLQPRRDAHDKQRQRWGLSKYHITDRMRRYTEDWLDQIPKHK